MVDCKTVCPCAWRATATRAGFILIMSFLFCLQPFVVPRLPIPSIARSRTPVAQLKKVLLTHLDSVVTGGEREGVGLLLAWQEAPRSPTNRNSLSKGLKDLPLCVLLSSGEHLDMESQPLLPSPIPRFSIWQCASGTRMTCCSHSKFLFTYRNSAEGALFNPSGQDPPQSPTMDVDPCKICGQGKEGGELLQCCEITCTMVAHPGCLPARAKQGARFSLREWRCPGCGAKREAALRQKTQSKTSDGLVKREGGRQKEGPMTKVEGGSKPALDGLCAAKGQLQKAETEVCKKRQGKKRVQKVGSDIPPGRSKRVKGLADLYPPDTVCSVCNSPDREDCMLLCETRGCQGTSHTFCCTPPLKAVPEGSWFCAQCARKRGSVKVEKEKGSGSGSKRANRQGKDTGQRKKSRVAMPAVKGRQEEEEPLVVLDAADSDSGPSVHPDAECDICHNPERGDVMLLCSGPGCESKQHTFCCIPPLEDVPGGDWFCPECAGERGVEGKVVKGLVDDGVRCLFHHKGRQGKILNQCGNTRAEGQRTCHFHVEYQRAAAGKAAKKKGLRTPGEVEDLKPVTDCSGVEAEEKPGGRTWGKLESDGSEMRQSEREEREGSPSRASSVHPDAECDVCGSPEDDDVMLLCSTHGCEGRQHTFCCRPKLKEVPSGDWFCPACKETKGGRTGGATQKAVFAAVAERVRDGVRCSAVSGGGEAMRQCVAARQEGYLRCAYHREQKIRQKERTLKRKANSHPERPSQGGGGREVGKEPDTKKEEGAMGNITKQKQGAKGKAGYWFYNLVDDGFRCTAYADNQEGKVRNQCRRHRAPGHRYCQHHVDLKLKVRARWVKKRVQLALSGAGSKLSVKEASSRGSDERRGGARTKVAKRKVLSGKERDGEGFGGRVRAKASKEGAQGEGGKGSSMMLHDVGIGRSIKFPLIASGVAGSVTEFPSRWRWKLFGEGWMSSYKVGGS
jgi:hypothetical protein